MRHYLKLSMLVVLLTMVVSLAAIKEANADRIDCKYLYIYVDELINSGGITPPPADATRLRNLEEAMLGTLPYKPFFINDVLIGRGFTNPEITRAYCSRALDSDSDGTMDYFDSSPTGTPLAGILYSPPSAAPSPELRPDCQAIAERVEELIRAGTIAVADLAAARNLNPETIMRYRANIVDALEMSRDPDLSIALCSRSADSDSDGTADAFDTTPRPDLEPPRRVVRADCDNFYMYIKRLIEAGTLPADGDYLSMNPGLLTGPHFTDEALTRAGITTSTRQTCSKTLDQDSDGIADAYDTEPLIIESPTSEDVAEEIVRLRARIAELEVRLEAMEEGEVPVGTEVPVITTPLGTPVEDETRDAGPSMLEGGGGTGGCSFIPPGN